MGGAFAFPARGFSPNRRALGEFDRWTEAFRGNKRPLDDISKCYRIYSNGRFDLDEEAQKAPQEFRQAVRILVPHPQRAPRKIGKAVELIAVSV